MIFVIWTMVWIYFATALPMLVVPGLVYLVRCGYLGRPFVTKVFALALIGGLIVFLEALSEGKEMELALVQGAKVPLSALILTHLFQGLRDLDVARLKWLGAGPGTGLVLFDRCRSLVLDRVSEIFAAAKIRWQAAKQLGWSRWEVVTGALRCVLNELCSLGDEVDRIRRTRGNIPVTAGWAVPFGSCRHAEIADLAILAVPIMVELFGGEGAVPKVLIQGVRGLFLSQ